MPSRQRLHPLHRLIAPILVLAWLAFGLSLATILLSKDALSAELPLQRKRNKPEVKLAQKFRVLVEAKDSSGRPDKALRRQIEAFLRRNGKFTVVSDAEMSKRFRTLKKSSAGPHRRSDQRCERGGEVSANYLLRVKHSKGSLSLRMLDAVSGCQRATASASWGRGGMTKAVDKVVLNLLARLKRAHLQMPPSLKKIHQIRKIKNRSSAGIAYIRISGGHFQMGSTDGKEEEKPVHEVTVSTFDMSKTEVTVAQYAACVKAGACTKAGFTEEKYCNWGKSGRLNHPINCVNWDQATDFAKWAGARLPSEAEWEYAARSGGHSQTYPWGNKVPSCRLAVMKRKGKDGCGKERTWPVCSHPAGNSAQGLCDLAGNVWEWVQDEYAGYGETPEEGPGYFDEDPAYVLRGGGWCCLAQCLRASGRTGFVSSYRNSNLGFRLARSVL